MLTKTISLITGHEDTQINKRRERDNRDTRRDKRRERERETAETPGETRGEEGKLAGGAGRLTRTGVCHQVFIFTCHLSVCQEVSEGWPRSYSTPLFPCT